MQIINKDKEEVKIRIDNAEDLWYLYHIINKGDQIKGQTFRKIKIGEEERKTQVTKKKVQMRIEVEKVEHQDQLLKVLGTIIEGPEDVKKGSHHSFNLEPGNTITIIKETWLRYHLQKLEEAATERPTILICVLDREEAIFAISKRKGYEVLAKIKGEVAKKEMEIKATGNFYHDITKLLEEYVHRYNLSNIIVASPAFWKEELMKEIKDKQLKEKIVLATSSSVGEQAIDEVMKRPEVKEVLKQIRLSKELHIVEELMTEIAKKELATYGTKEVDEAAKAGAIKVLMLTDKYMQKTREEEKYAEIDEIMKLTDQTKGEIHIISSEHEGGKKLDSLGGIAAILRYKIN